MPQRSAQVLWLGSFSGKVEPLEERLHLADQAGEILLLKQDGALVKPRDQWALMNQSRLLHAEKKLALAEKSLGLGLDDLAQRYKKEQGQLNKKLKSISDELTRLEQLRTLTSEGEFDEEINAAIMKVKEEGEELKQAFESDYSPGKQAYERENLQHNIETQRMDLARLRRDSYLEAKVTGKVQYLIPANDYDPERAQVAWVNAGDVIALIRNDEEVVVSIPELHFDKPLERELDYIARVASASGMSLTAEYYERKTVMIDAKPKQFYLFKVGKGDLPVARKIVGEKAIVNVLQKFPEPVTILEKEDLIKFAPEEVQSTGWVKTVLKLFPGHKVLGIGKGAIAIQPKG